MRKGEGVHLFLYGARREDDVFAGSFLDVQADDLQNILVVRPHKFAVLRFGAKALQASIRGSVLVAEIDAGHVAYVDRLPPRRLDHDVFYFVGNVEGAVHADQVVQAIHVHGPARHVCVFRANGVHDIHERKVVSLERIQVHVDLHFALQAAYYVHLQHPLHRLDLFFQFFRHLLELRQRIIRRQVDGHDGEFREVDFANDRFLDFAGQGGPGYVHLVAYLLVGVVYGNVRLELHDDGGYALHRRGTNFLDAVDGLYFPLDGLRDQGFHVVGACAGIQQGNDDLRNLDRGIGLLRNGSVAIQPAYGEYRCQDDNARAILDRDVGDFHNATG